MSEVSWLHIQCKAESEFQSLDILQHKPSNKKHKKKILLTCSWSSHLGKNMKRYLFSTAFFSENFYFLCNCYLFDYLVLGHCFLSLQAGGLSNFIGSWDFPNTIFTSRAIRYQSILIFILVLLLKPLLFHAFQLDSISVYQFIWLFRLSTLTVFHLYSSSQPIVFSVVFSTNV